MNPPRSETVSHGIIARYGDRLGLTPQTPRISLAEGGTPCIEAPRIANRLRLGSLHLKFEGLNPTGSFKDRGMVLAVARAIEAGSSIIICASTGNTSASAAAYGARFGVRTVVVIPAGRIALGKLVQAQVYGAEIVAIEGSFDAALDVVRELADHTPAITLVNSVNPHRIEGQKTAAFEIVDELGAAPDVLAIPVGNAGNITAYWRGFREYAAEGRCRLPRMIGGQAAGAAPLVLGHPVEHPETIATAIRIGRPASGPQALAARDESGGLIDSVTDKEIRSAQREIAGEGVFCEPASAAALAVLDKAIRNGAVAPGSHAVVVLTGNGLKDTDAVRDALTAPTLIVGSAAALADHLGVRPTIGVARR